MSRPKLAVIGASHFQLPLIQTAQRMGCEVHAFAWQCGDVGESEADVFHPVSITEVDSIVHMCQQVGIEGVCTIASDLATVAVTHVANALGLVGNSLTCMQTSTNKNLMRMAFAKAGDPSPKSMLVQEGAFAHVDPAAYGLAYPLIVKPTDRSGSRGVTRLESPLCPVTLDSALRIAFDQSFAKEALVEEFATGDEFSVEGLSWEGEHHILAITRKGTTGAPHFIETSHLQPAGLTPANAQLVKSVTTHALDTLGIRYGASHTELKIAADGSIRIIEIGGRMGGDCIGSHLVPLSTGVDYVRAVVDIALGREPDLTPTHAPAAALVRFLFGREDFALLDRIGRERPDLMRYSYVTGTADNAAAITDSSTRLGHFVLAAPRVSDLAPYLPPELKASAEDAAHE